MLCVQSWRKQCTKYKACPDARCLCTALDGLPAAPCTPKRARGTQGRGEREKVRGWAGAGKVGGAGASCRDADLFVRAWEGIGARDIGVCVACGLAGSLPACLSPPASQAIPSSSPSSLLPSSSSSSSAQPSLPLLFSPRSFPTPVSPPPQHRPSPISPPPPIPPFVLLRPSLGLVDYSCAR